MSQAGSCFKTGRANLGACGVELALHRADAQPTFAFKALGSGTGSSGAAPSVAICRTPFPARTAPERASVCPRSAPTR